MASPAFGPSLDGPPPPAGQPSVGSIPPSPPGMGGPGAGPQMGALPRLVFQIEQSLQTLARALPPETSRQIDAIKEQLRQLVAGSLSGSSPGQPTSPTEEGGPY